MPRVGALAVPFALSASLLAPLRAQAVHVVGPGGYPQITAAIAAASPGDLVLVQPGQYDMFFLTKGLTIRALAPGAEAVLAPSLFSSSNIVNPPAGQTAHIVGMKLGTTYLWGTATLDRCVLDGPGARLVIANTTAVVQSCTLTPALPSPAVLLPPTLRCTSSDVTVLDSTIHAIMWSGNPGPLPIELVDTRFRGSGLTVVGPPSSTMPALQADGPSRVWLSDSTLTAAPGACLLPVGATLLAPNGRYDRCTLTPSCSTLPQGFVLGIRAPQPPQNGAPFTLEFRAQPFSMVGVFAANTIARATLPGFDQTLLLSLSEVFPVANLIADATGLAAGTWSIPANPAFVDIPLWFQGFAGPALPLQASGIAGGLVR